MQTTSFTPRAQAAGPLPASAYTQERRLLSRYEYLLYSDPATDVEELMNALWGPGLTQKQMYGDKATDGKIDRLDYGMPDLIRLLKPEEQPPLAELLDAGDLLGAIRLLLARERTLTQREHDPNLKLRDNARQAGLGILTSQAYGHLHPGYLFRLPEPKAAPARPMLRPKARKRRPAPHWLRARQLELF